MLSIAVERTIRCDIEAKQAALLEKVAQNLLELLERTKTVQMHSLRARQIHSKRDILSLTDGQPVDCLIEVKNRFGSIAPFQQLPKQPLGIGRLR
ncbi:hypothetical protein [Comamonas sp. JUb58]|uniref:hypothetical protein n=1 Tax=Comamonas sp. JUb58 TaxID=2485114 RepID=UPI001060EB26|nr:hypothetical protein [Comamonas sp. JUb58]